MKIGGILETTGLTLYQITSTSDEPGVAGQIFKFYAQREINLEYITESSTVRGTAVLALCIKDVFVNEVDSFVAENQDKIGFLKIKKTENVSIIGIYGPHFREKHSIAARFCAILGAAGVNILGISSSISSVCCLIKSEHLENAKSAILKRYELP